MFALLKRLVNNDALKQNITIRSFWAGLLLLIALLGATPRQYLHNLLADHVDADYGFRGKQLAVSAKGYDCGFYHPVATAPHQPEPTFCWTAHLPKYPAVVFIAPYAFSIQGYVPAGTSRGPPCCLSAG